MLILLLNSNASVLKKGRYSVRAIRAGDAQVRISRNSALKITKLKNWLTGEWATGRRFSMKLSAKYPLDILCRTKICFRYPTLKNGQPLPCCPLTCQRGFENYKTENSKNSRGRDTPHDAQPDEVTCTGSNRT